ncbi:MAG: 3-hydroxyacyl-ACP dehydratase FabZ, partial [Planctomycetota bacterium]
IDNLVVRLSGAECPGMDGSAAPFADLLDSLEAVDQDAPRPEIGVKETLAVGVGPDAALVAMPSEHGMEVSYTLDYWDNWLGRQHFGLAVTADRFRAEVAPARTFCLDSEAEALRAAGLGKGATYENTLVVGEDGVIENEPRWPDEFARHKVLDLLGDLFLVGADLQGHVHAYRTGHAANLSLVRALRSGESGALMRREAPLPSPAMLQGQIRRILPHRYPFLLVDRVLSVEGFKRAVGLKNVTMNEPFFQGHYPEEPIMPGVLIIEAMAQLAGLLLLRKLELTGKVPVLLSIDRVKFRRAVVPGDQLRLEAETLRLSGSRGRVQCRSYVGDKLVAESRLNFAMTGASEG